MKSSEDDWLFSPDEKHRFYWEVFPVPVLLMLHSPLDRRTYWVDARQSLRSSEQRGSRPIAVPRTNILQRASASDLFYTAGGSSHDFLGIPDVLKLLCTTSTHSRSFPISYFDLFANGLTNIANSVYYGMDLVMEVVEARLPEGENWVTFGSDEHDFLFGYLRLLVEQHLADVDISNCLVDWHERETQPTTIAPLTSRGRELVRFIYERQRKFEQSGRLEVPERLGVAQEDFVRMAFRPSHYSRLPLIAAFQELVLEDIGRGT